MKALAEMNLTKAICGFDGITLLGYTQNAINTVRQDFSALSAKAVDELDNLIQGGVGRLVPMPYKIVQINYLDIIV